MRRYWVGLTCLWLLTTGCATSSTDQAAETQGVDAAILRSETVPLDPTSTTTVPTTTTTADETETATPDPDGTPTELSTDPAVAYLPGTCYEPPAPGLLAEQLDCGIAHTVEVYAVADLPGDPDAPFLGLEDAIALCNEDFTSVTGVGIGLATTFRRSVLRPSEETWSQGEREVTCFVVFPVPTTDRLGDIDPLRGFGYVSLYGMNAGDCFNDFNDEETRFTLVACSEPHNAEVFVDLELPAGPFPGDAEIERISDDACFGTNFTDFVGIGYDDSRLSSLRSRPSEETWNAGDQTINCILTDGSVHDSSFEGSAE